eukprot:3597638-Amphidinium_carterae.1
MSWMLHSKSCNTNVLFSIGLQPCVWSAVSGANAPCRNPSTRCVPVGDRMAIDLLLEEYSAQCTVSQVRFPQRF